MYLFIIIEKTCYRDDVGFYEGQNLKGIRYCPFVWWLMKIETIKNQVFDDDTIWERVRIHSTPGADVGKK